MKDKFKERDELIFGKRIKFPQGGVERFSKLTLEKIEKLLQMGMINLLASYNCSPKVQDYVEVMKKYPGKFVVHGYVVTDKRNDTRVTIEGLESIVQLDDKAMLEVVLKFRKADVLNTLNGFFYCWYD